MGKYNKGVNGSFRGLVGTAVGSKWNGISYMRSKPDPSTKPPSLKQLVQHAKFAVIQRFLGSVSGLIRYSFDGAGNGKTGANIAFKHVYSKALTGTYPAFSLQYPQVLVSSGKLLNAGNPTAAAGGTGEVKMTWSDNSGVAFANADDRSIIVVHCPELNKSTYSLTGSARNTGTDSINVSAFSGKTVQTWLTFISSDESEVATSVYAGEVVVL